ncbi:MAG: type II toxin-antitoxin system VapC family toxin [Acidimicrobiia bacterium]
MAVVYFDASALVKLVVQEDGSHLASRLWDDCDAALSSRIAYPEVCAALAAAGRNRTLTAAGVRQALASWEEFWAGLRPVELTAEVARRAGELARTRSLRGADAVHLASVAALGRAEVVFAVWDRRLHAGARAEAISVAPSALP